MTTICSICGAQLEEAAQFCAQCGTQTAAASAKKKRPIIVTCLGCGCAAIVCFGVMIALIIWFAMSSLNNAAKEDYYVLGNDKIPSVKLALGEERKITGLNVSTALGGATKKEFKYQVPGTEQGREMFEYYTYLHDKDGFLRLGDIDFNESAGKGVVARNSVDDGHEIQLQIEYDAVGYTITIVKQPGGVTPVTPENDTTLVEE